MIVRELGQPSLTIEPDRAKIARYGLNVSDINTLIETAVRRHAGDAGHSGRASVRPRRAHAGAIPQNMERDQEPADRYARRPAPAAQPVRRHQGRTTARRSSIARRIRASSASSSASRDATWRARSAKRARRWRQQCTCRSATRSTGAANTRSIWRRAAQMMVILPMTVAADPADPVRALRQPEIPADHHVQRAGDRCRSAACWR